jgi:hypothetical protein
MKVKPISSDYWGLRKNVGFFAKTYLPLGLIKIVDSQRERKCVDAKTNWITKRVNGYTARVREEEDERERVKIIDWIWTVRFSRQLIGSMTNCKNR